MKTLLLTLLVTLSLNASNGFISPKELHSHLDDKNLVLLDVSSKEDYAKAHIKGAHSTSYQLYRHNVATYSLMNSPKELETLMRSYGVNNNSKIVIYEQNKDKGLLKASYVALAFARVGFRNVEILNGGIGEWTYFEYPVTTVVPKKSSGNLNAKADDSILIDMAYVQKNLGKLPMVEARPADFYFGTIDSSGVKRNGHIKGGMSNHWRNSFEDDGTLYPKARLDETFYKGLELKQNEEVILYCTGGLEASMNWYVLDRVMGFTNLKVYDASLREWGNREDTPMARYKWEVFR